jgi:hypothetical protein
MRIGFVTTIDLCPLENVVLRLTPSIFVYSDTGDDHLKATLESSFGQISYQTRQLVSEELDLMQKKHKELILSWDSEVEQIAALGVAFRAAVPAKWSALMIYLKTYNQPEQRNSDLDLLIEDTELHAQDSDGESDNGDIAPMGDDTDDGELPQLDDLSGIAP